jgi:hypothetical protein
VNKVKVNGKNISGKANIVVQERSIREDFVTAKKYCIELYYDTLTYKELNDILDTLKKERILNVEFAMLAMREIKHKGKFYLGDVSYVTTWENRGFITNVCIKLIGM